MKVTAATHRHVAAHGRRTLGLLRAIVPPLVQIALIGCTFAASSPSIDEPPTDDGHRKIAGPVAQSLKLVYEQRCKSDPSVPQSQPQEARQQASGEFVTVDAIAKADARLLLEQLASIGLRGGQVAAPVVSGQLPICAVSVLETCCSELRMIRDSTAAHRQR